MEPPYDAAGGTGVIVLDKVRGEAEALEHVGTVCFEEETAGVFKDLRLEDEDIAEMAGFDLQFHAIRGKEVVD